MGHLIVSLFVFAAVMFCTVVLFGAWLVVTIGRFLARILSGPSPRPKAINGVQGCGNERCLANNPSGANYCRRCGRQLRPMPQRISMRRAAMW